MKIQFCLPWVQNNKKFESSFKSSSCALLVQEYTKRIHMFTPCGISGAHLEDFKNAPEVSQTKVWMCDRSAKAQALSSEDLAKKLANVMNSSTKTLNIFLGQSEGFNEKILKEKEIPIHLRWSFGNLTLPHELAAVVATEQIYRAFEIIRGGPYHK
jgi:23S rRNA (pseudouridine1915-N3)-methyltransferase